MNATSTLRPRASSPFSIDGPSAKMSRGFTRSPTFTSGRWLYEVPWLERMNFCNLYFVKSPLTSLPSTTSMRRTWIERASTCSTIPSYFATTAAPESRASTCSIPVPTNGASGLSSGTA